MTACRASSHRTTASSAGRTSRADRRWRGSGGPSGRDTPSRAGLVSPCRSRLEGSEAGRVCLFLVPRAAGGVRLNVAPALDGRLGATVSLAGAKVAADAKLGDGDEDRLGVIDRLLDRGAIAVCAEACGAMAAVTQA